MTALRFYGGLEAYHAAYQYTNASTITSSCVIVLVKIIRKKTFVGNWRFDDFRYFDSIEVILNNNLTLTVM